MTPGQVAILYEESERGSQVQERRQKATYEDLRSWVGPGLQFERMGGA